MSMRMCVNHWFCFIYHYTMQVMKPKSTDVQKMLFSRENTKLSKNKYTGGLFQYKWKPFFVEVLPKSS